MPTRVTPPCPNVASTLRRFAAVLALTLAASASAAAPALAAGPVKIYAAGSLSGVMTAMIAASGQPVEAFAKPVFGPAGLLSQRIVGGEAADLFFSADLVAPERAARGATDPFVKRTTRSTNDSAVLRDLVDATIGFQRLATGACSPSKSLLRMREASGDTQSLSCSV